jgi:NDP-hexose-3-ketoreductase
MDVLIIGLGSIVERRVLPALAALPAIGRIDVATRSRAQPATWPKQGRFFRDYAAAIAESDAALIYVSLPNSAHVEWIEAGLAAGKHVVVDKPATLTRAEAERCVASAEARGLLLAEATAFAYHSQVATLRALAEEIGPVTHVDAQFIIPPMPIDNFRNYRALGGGSLHDMGPYAAATARLFGGGRLTGLAAFPAPPASDRDIDMGFSLLAQFEGGARYTGNFSFESEYQNRLTLSGHHGSVGVERIFSAPAEFAPTWQVRRANKASEELQPASDAFLAFLDAVVQATESGAHRAFHDDLVADAAFRDALAAALGYGDLTQ